MTARRLAMAILPAALLAFVTSPLADAADEATKKITFDDIKLELKKDEKFDREKHLTDKVEKLNGKKISIKGWIHPLSVFTQTGIKKFVLVRDDKECCFGPGAALHDCIYVTMTDGKTTSFTTKPITVEGAFRIEEVPGVEGRQVAIYQLEGNSAK